MENSGSHKEMMVPPVEGVAGGGTAYGWSESGTQTPSLPTGLIDPLKIHSSELVHVWCIPSSANVGPQDMPRTLEPISLLAARNERESVQIALRPKVSWAGSSFAGTVQVQCSDLRSTFGDSRLVAGESITVRRVVPILGVPDALVPLEVPVFQLTLFPGETTAIWVSIDVPTAQPPDNGSVDMMDEDAISNLSIRVKLSLTVWDFILPVTPSLPAVIGISDTVIEDRFGVEHGSSQWYEALDQHFKWLLQYKISPYFCRWGEGMRVLTYSCPWPADHPKSDEYFGDPRLAAYAVPCRPVVSCGDTAKDFLQREVEILRTKNHWRKAYFYLWDEPLNLEHYNAIRDMASEIHAYAPDARIMTTYYCGPSDAPLASNNFEAFVKVPEFLRPHTQIYCTSEWVIGNREDLAKDIIAEIQPENGEEWWTYVCMGPSDPHPNWHLGMRGTQHRAVMWRVWKEGGTGFLYWGANCYEKATVPSAEIRFRRGLPPGDGVLYYPGQVFSSSPEPVASLRLERLLSGLQDIEYLKYYSSRFGREEGLHLLERTGIYLGPERYTHDHMPIDVMRAEVFRTCQTESEF
ncbi:uncharacterized protein LOC142524274 isoform X6 [Primulina tabacum]|uniref:uncharacterized protein LOC142524274 isoform X6 n=1 Tax=Primulina tabacum TaxID=48773 RepID=UPI003F5AB5AB